MMKPANLKFCPQCGSIGYQYRDRKYWYCPVCLFTYFHNVATSASVIIEFEGRVLLLERNRNPGIGLLGLPGGFVDPGERAEEAAVRECREETGLEVADLSYIGSWPNEYAYKSVVYRTCDLYFGARFSGTSASILLDECEVSSFRLLSAAEIPAAPIAFESHRSAILKYFEVRRPADRLP